jgi:hypothetical protein
MNIPDDPNKTNVPQEAKGNPVYEQTRQDMPLWCCGRNCGRNSRYVECRVWTFIALLANCHYIPKTRDLVGSFMEKISS